MIRSVTESEVWAAEMLFYLSAALKNGVDAHILAPEHSSVILKNLLRELGIEAKKKEVEIAG